MNKDEILKKSRAEKNDEGMRQAENQGRRVGQIAFCCVFVFVIIFNLFNNQNNYAPMSMFWAFIAAEAYPKYQFTKRKAFLISTIAGAVASIASLLSFIIASLR